MMVYRSLLNILVLALSILSVQVAAEVDLKDPYKMV